MNAKYLFTDAAAVKAEISSLLSKYPELGEDAQLLLDTIEGETSLHEILERALNVRQEALTIASALKDRETAMSERRKRYERQGEAAKRIMHGLMEAAGITKPIELTEATISILKGRTSVHVHDVDALGQGMYKLERAADKAAIKAQIEAGEDVPGAYLVKGEDTVSVRTK